MAIRTQHASSLARILLDLSMVVLSWLISYIIRFYTIFESPLGIPQPSLYIKLVPFIIVIWLLCFFVLGFLQRSSRPRSAFLEALDIIQTCFFATLAFIAFTYFYEEYRYSRITLFIFASLHPLMMIGGRSLLRKYLRFQNRREAGKRTLILSTRDRIKECLEFIGSQEPIKRQLVAIIPLDQRPTGSDVTQHPESNIIDMPEDLRSYLIEHSIEEAVIAPNPASQPLVSQFLNDIALQVPTLSVLPDFGDYSGFTPVMQSAQSQVHLQYNSSPMNANGALLKRIVDLLLSIIGLVVLSPLMMIIAMLVKLTSPGPVFYRQERVGLDGRNFQMLKFRSMPVDAESKSGAVWATQNDQRPTALGRFMRKTSIDELPQLFNIIQGQMSLVGPRPERPVFVEDFRTKIPGYMLRHKFKAGLTGWAQVNGLRGNTSLQKRIEYDLYYIQNWSIALDLKIIVMTAVKIFFDRNAY